jgi:hypothetical protein
MPVSCPPFTCLSHKNLVILEFPKLLQIMGLYFLLHPLSLFGDQFSLSFWYGPMVTNRFNDDMEN